jgi:hypothetical protein
MPPSEQAKEPFRQCARRNGWTEELIELMISMATEIDMPEAEGDELEVVIPRPTSRRRGGRSA